MLQLHDISAEQDGTEYTMHLVPCKIRVAGPTAELTTNFDEDLEESKTDGSRVVNYIRGRKLVGKSLSCFQDCDIVLLDQDCEASTGTNFTPSGRVSSIVNYEREGNEQRLQEEMEKFNEFLQLSETIHG